MAQNNTLIEAFEDDSIRFVPQHTKEDAHYTTNIGPEIPADARCGNCAHFIPGGGCHVVQGEIDPSGVCLEFYADFGIFADNKIRAGDPVSMTLAPSDLEEWTAADARNFLLQVERKIKTLGVRF